MKKRLLIFFVLFISHRFLCAQTNTFPASGNVGIGTTNPATLLSINKSTSSNLFGNYPAIEINNPNTTGDAFSALVFKNGTVPANGVPGGVGYLLSHTLNDNSGQFLWLRTFAPSYPLYLGTNQSDLTILNGNVGIGTVSPQVKFSTYQANALGTALNNFSKLIQVGGNVGSNQIQNSIWLRRVTAGDNTWYSTVLHDGISVDASFGSPGVDTRTWWERNPGDNIQSWGQGSTTYMIINKGKVGIGTSNPAELLSVNGTILGKKIRISQVTADWPDYVFEPCYKLPSLASLEAFIKVNKHLPGVPSAKEVTTNGIELGNTQAVLLKKIEELTLYIIDLKKANDVLKKDIEELKSRLK